MYGVDCPIQAPYLSRILSIFLAVCSIAHFLPPVYNKNRKDVNKMDAHQAFSQTVKMRNDLQRQKDLAKLPGVESVLASWDSQLQKCDRINNLMNSVSPQFQSCGVPVQNPSEDLSHLRDMVDLPDKISYEQLNELRSQTNAMERRVAQSEADSKQLLQLSTIMKDRLAQAQKDTEELKKLNKILENELQEMKSQTIAMEAQVRQSEENSKESKKESRRSFIISVISIGIAFASLITSIILPLIH